MARTAFETRLVLFFGLSVGVAGLSILALAGFAREPLLDAHIVPLRQVEVGSAAALEELFSAEDYDWPPSSGASVPRLALTSLPEDLGDRAVQHKKSLFMRSLLPLVLRREDFQTLLESLPFLE